MVDQVAERYELSQFPIRLLFAYGSLDKVASPAALLDQSLLKGIRPSWVVWPQNRVQLAMMSLLSVTECVCCR